MGGAAPTATLTLDKPGRWLPQGGSYDVSFKIARNGVPGALTVHADSAPAGVTVPDVMVPDGASDGKLTLSASAATTPGATGDVVIDLLDGNTKEDTKTLKVALSGKPGDVDTTWGNMGVSEIAVSPGNAGVTDSKGYDIAVYPASAGANAGKVVAFGRLTVGGVINGVLLRFNTDGSLDTTFGDKIGATRMGYTVFSLDAKTAVTSPSVAIDSKGRIVAAAGLLEGACPVFAERFTVVGEVDATFAKFEYNLNSDCGFFQTVQITANDDVALLADWKLGGGNQQSIVQVLSGSDGSKLAYYHLWLVGGDGEHSTLLHSLTIDSQGRYVLAGDQCVGGYASNVYDCKSVIARLSKDGTIDATFGAQGGYALFDFGMATDEGGFWGVTVDAKDNPIAVGRSGNTNDATIEMVNASDGAPTASFGMNGSVLRDAVVGSLDQGFVRPLIDEEGRIVTVGYATTNGSDSINLVRSRSDAKGGLDMSYGMNGYGTTSAADTGTGALAPDQRLYVVASVPRGGSGTDIAVFRYWP
jgi:uncharacterized delta-60 repeat protein